MGRAKILWTFTRNIEATMTGITIQYKIPIHDEKQYLGEFKDATIKDGMLIVNYSATQDAKQFTKPPIVFEKVEREITFE